MTEDEVNGIAGSKKIVDTGVVPLNLETEIQECYLSYAMSVIVGRALPDIRDGLKPVHRRVLYAMHELNNVHNKPYMKSARVVGEVMGKYHPHGDMAIYNTLVRMAQPFSLRYPLIDGQGNFGSIDGDDAAAMRYTEVRMQRMSSEILQDLEKKTVDFVSNYDEKLKEPVVLPARIPNLLINGSQGIAVGMATHIPPHNLSEIVDALKAVIGNSEITNEGLMEYVKGPDFPTAGYICGKAGIIDAYTKGRGVIQVRAKAEIEIHKKDRERIIITEIPYLVNKSLLILQIAELVKNKRVDGIVDIRDESDLSGIRIVIDIRKGSPGNIILNNLFKFTSLQSSFGIILLALLGNSPKIFTLKEMLVHFITHRKEVTIRRTQFELERAQERAHILEGLRIALENIDEVIELIKAAKDTEIARRSLKVKFDFSATQVQAILDMKLQRLTGLEREKIIQDYKDVLVLIKHLKGILSSEAMIFRVILDEFEEIKDRYGDGRRTRVIEDTVEMNIEDIISDDIMVIARTHYGYVKRSPIDIYRSQKRGGRGVMGMSTREEDFVETIFAASTHSSLLVFTNLGRCFRLKVHEIPLASRIAKGVAIVNLLEMRKGEKPMTVLPVKSFIQGNYIILVTSRGIVKKMDVMHFERVINRGIIAIRLDNEELIAATLIRHEDEHIFIGTKSGQSIRFDHKDLRDMGRTARGVKGINLVSGDVVVGSEILDKRSGKATILTITEKGFGKRTKLEEYRLQGRGGSGIKTVAVMEKNGNVVSMKQVTDDNEIMVITSSGNIIRMKAGDISVQGRNTQGVRVVRLSDDETVAGVARIDMEEKQEDSHERNGQERAFEETGSGNDIPGEPE